MPGVGSTDCRLSQARRIGTVEQFNATLPRRRNVPDYHIRRRFSDLVRRWRARFAIGLTFRPMVTEFGWARGELGLAIGAYLVVSAFAT
jgi:hypothetical protein